MSGTWTERYYARGCCSLCGTVLWCSTLTDTVTCSTSCGQAILSGDGQGTNIVPCSDQSHEAALRAERRLGDALVVLVDEGGG